MEDFAFFIQKPLNIYVAHLKETVLNLIMLA